MNRSAASQKELLQLTRLLPLSLLRSFGSVGGEPAVLDCGIDKMELSSESDSDKLMPSCLRTEIDRKGTYDVGMG